MPCSVLAAYDALFQGCLVDASRMSRTAISAPGLPLMGGPQIIERTTAIGCGSVAFDNGWPFQSDRACSTSGGMSVGFAPSNRAISSASLARGGDGDVFSDF